MKNLLLLSFLFLSVLFPAQKKSFFSNETLLKSIIPNPKVNSWVLIFNEYSKDRILKQTGRKLDYFPQFSGFRMDNSEDHFFYIAYSEGKEILYVKSFEELKSFIGSINNAEEAALISIIKGYFLDFEYKDYAANYQDLGENFAIEAGKITSNECPLAKSHFLVTVNKKTGEIVSEKDLGRYNEVYKKDCKNNPHYDEVKKQMEEAKLRAEEQKKIQKEMTEKMRKKLEKSRRKD